MLRILILTIIFTVSVNTLHSQNLVGDWHGQLDVHGTKLRISFHVKYNNGEYTTTMDSPDQKAFGIPTDKTVVTDNSISISLTSLSIIYIGTLSNNKIQGVFSQGGKEFELDLSPKPVKKQKTRIRPQNPQKPYPYLSEEVIFNNEKDSIKLAGTLTIPKNIIKPTVVILISGSGPQNRDEEILEHKPFLVLSDYLTKRGIAVLRYDDRGVGHSEGTQRGATSADFATDVESAIKYLKTRKDIDVTKIGLIGHSEGGFIAPMVASIDETIAFIVLLAGTGVDGGTILRTQTNKHFELIGGSKDNIQFNDKISKEIYSIIKEEFNASILKNKIRSYLQAAKNTAPIKIANELTDDDISAQIKAITSPWMLYFIRTNPKQFLEKVTCPVLALNGAKDFQVLPKINLNGIKKALRNNKDVTINELSGLNHLFQTCETGAFDEYATINETFSPKALEIIANWITKRF